MMIFRNSGLGFVLSVEVKGQGHKDPKVSQCLSMRQSTHFADIH